MRSLAVTVLTVLTAAILFSAAASAASLTTNGGETIETEDLTYCTQDKEAPVVYYISEISPQSLVKIYRQDKRKDGTAYAAARREDRTGQPSLQAGEFR